MNNKILLILCSLIATLAFLASLYSGCIPLSWDSPILWQIRLPLSLTAFIVGAMLALSGLYLQILLMNPLAEPYLLGLSGGAAAFYLFGLLAAIPSLFLPFASFLGAIVSVGILLICTRSLARNHQLILSGVLLASGWGALISLLLILLPNQTLHASLFWLMGDLNLSTIHPFSIAVLFITTLVGCIIASSLNILAIGDFHAINLGVNINAIKWLLFIMSSLLTALSVATAGCIGFVGLITPHLLRLLGCSNYRYLIPCTVLTGGALVCFANAAARTFAYPLELPVGIMTCSLGVPLMLALLQRRNK